jgi:E3 ubiquitin-protein ligase listerin
MHAEWSLQSLKVRLSYIDQLRGRSLIGVHLMPTMLAMLGVDAGASKAFKLDMWAVDEFYIECEWTFRQVHIDANDPHSVLDSDHDSLGLILPVFAAHIYYRALVTVPSVIHGWVLDCKDRQISSAVTKYTSTYFSPRLIQQELAHVKNTTDLTSESMTVKVASVVNEVTASYLIDEHQLEMKLKIPGDWPLHKIEIKDGKKVGVDDRHWRAWTLAVQQTIWAQVCDMIFP